MFSWRMLIAGLRKKFSMVGAVFFLFKLHILSLYDRAYARGERIKRNCQRGEKELLWKRTTEPN